MTAATGWMIGYDVWLRLFGGLYLCYLGVTIYRSRPSADVAERGAIHVTRAFSSTFLLTLTNPATVFAFMAIFAGFVDSSVGNYATTSLLVLGVFLGSALWWLLLSGSVSLLRAKVTAERMRWINRIAGGLIVGFGLATLLRLSRLVS